MQQFLRTKTLLSFVFALSFLCVPTLALAQEDGEQQGPAPEQQQQYDEPTQSAQTSSDDNSLYGGSTEGASTASFSFFDTPALETSGWGGEGSLGEPQVGGGSTGFSELQRQLTQSAEQTYNGPTEVPIEYSNRDQQDLLNSQLPNKYDYINQSLTNTNNVGTYDFFPEGTVSPEFNTLENSLTRNELNDPYLLNKDVPPVSALDYQRLDQAQARAEQDALNAQLNENAANNPNLTGPDTPTLLQNLETWAFGGPNEGGDEKGVNAGGKPLPSEELGTTLESGIKELRTSPETGSKEDYIFSEKNGGSWIPLPLSGQERTDVVNRLQAEGYLAEGQNAKIVEVRDGAINAEPIGFGLPGMSPTSPSSSAGPDVNIPPGSSAGGKPLPYDEKESTMVPAGQTLGVADGKGSRLLLATPGVGGSSPAPEQASTPAPSTQSGGGLQNFVGNIGSAVGEFGAKVGDVVGKGITSVADTLSGWGSSIGGLFSSTPPAASSGSKYLDSTPSVGDSPVNQAGAPTTLPVTPVSAPTEPTPAPAPSSPAPAEQKVGGPSTTQIPPWKEEEETVFVPPAAIQEKLTPPPPGTPLDSPASKAYDAQLTRVYEAINGLAPDEKQALVEQKKQLEVENKPVPPWMQSAVNQINLQNAILEQQKDFLKRKGLTN
ncbi:MAG: hypothetical protein NT019_01890 [Candidatus Adlerbacteria bacterium]|nr:hypothetical protein [Candidatus Adlerbacteria bacterium]